MKTFVHVLFLLVFTIGVFSANLIRMKELTNPLAIDADNDQIYITEGATVYIYSLKEIKFKKRFGRKGEGPGEFKIRIDRPLTLCVRDNDLVVSSFGRFSYFSKDGTYKSETKTKPVYTMAAKAFGSQFVGIGVLSEEQDFLTLNIYDEQLNKKKELFRVEEEIRLKGKKSVYYHLHFPVSFATSFIPYEDRVYVTWGKDDKIKVFENTGKKVAEIPVKTEKQKLTQAYKDKVANHFKNDKSLPQPIYERYYKNIVFPEFFPAIRDMRISDGKIYVVSYQKEKELTRILIFDLKGKPIKTVTLPLKDMDVKSIYPFTIKNGKLYQLVEDFDNENWYLHVTTI